MPTQHGQKNFSLFYHCLLAICRPIQRARIDGKSASSSLQWENERLSIFFTNPSIFLPESLGKRGYGKGTS